MKGFFISVARLFAATAMLFTLTSAVVPSAQAWVLGRPQILRLRRTSTPTPTPNPTPTTAPSRTPTPVPPTPTPMPKPSASTTPVATPTPTNIGTEITINTPGNGQTVSGTAVTVAITVGPDVYWNQLQVDGTSALSGSGNFTWNSTTVANGAHKLMVRVFQQGGTVPIGTAYVSTMVNNSTATPTPGPSTPTPAPPTPTPG